MSALARRVLCTLAFALAACHATIEVELPEPVERPGGGVLLAGASRADITPHPGFPMGGHSIGGKIARGWWTRLYARAVYLEDADGSALMLVSCDLWSLPAGLADRVAEILGGEEATAHLGREHLLIAATHTHHSPGNFSSSEMYNAYGSPLSGFDERLFEYLARRIAGAALAAARAAEPAELAFAELSPVEGVARNRSMEAFLRNPEAAGILGENAAIPLPPDPQPALYPDARSRRAVDPRLQALFVSRAAARDELLAAVGFFAVHTTSIGNGLEVYSADLFGAASRLAAGGWRRGDAAPVVAWFNGAEGDVSPVFVEQNRADAVALGRRLSKALTEARERAEPLAAPRLSSALGYYPIAGQKFCDVYDTTRRTAKKPVAGVGALGGAEDGLTLFHDLGWVEGVTGKRTVEQGSKHPAFDPRFLPVELPISITALVARSEAPSEIPLSVHRIGPLWLVGLPGEFTTSAGRRIRTTLEAKADGGPIVLAGLAGEYLSYFTTPEEYEEQHYEGASTLYGPAAMPLVHAKLHELVDEGAEPPRGERRHRAGRRKRFDVDGAGERPYRPLHGLTELVAAPGSGAPAPAPACTWEEPAPRLPKEPDGTERLTPEIAIEVDDGGWRPYREDGAQVDDTGLQLVVTGHAVADAVCWNAVWLAPNASEGRYRYRVRRVDSKTEYSVAFSLPANRSWTSELPLAD